MVSLKKIVLIVLLLNGCSSTKTTTVTESHDDMAGTGRTTTVEKVETEEHSGGCGGVLSCTVDVIGEVIALPFRAVGALFRAIF